MPATSVVGLETATNVFQFHEVDSRGKVRLRKRLRRGQLTDFFANPPVCIVGLEVTQGAHHWARVLGTFGHTVRLIAPQFVKPYLQSQKNAINDGAAICEAISLSQMRYVPTKTVEQQDLQTSTPSILERNSSNLFRGATGGGVEKAITLSCERSRCPSISLDDHRKTAMKNIFRLSWFLPLEPPLYK